MLVYVIRHGQTDWNAIRRLQGQKDIPLNDFGRSQAVANGNTLRDILKESAPEFDYVASPLGRTRETMELLRGAMGLEPQAYRTDERLVEVSFGDWEGQTLPELKLTQPEKVRARKTAKWDFIPPGQDAESYEILSWRIGAWLSSVDRKTVCVCHGGVIRSIFRLVTDMNKEDAAEIPIPQDRILKVETDAGTAEWITATSDV